MIQICPSKVCFKCGLEKPLSEFYRHSAMADGHLNKCKECAKKDVRANYYQNHDHYMAYEKLRKTRPSRKAQHRRYTVKWRKENPLKYKAHTAVNNAIRDGRLFKRPCKVCGSSKRVEAHHTDYRKPLKVIWLCTTCHKKLHKGKLKIA